MKNFAVTFLSVSIASLAFSSAAFAKNDGSDIPACAGVTNVCMSANVSATDSKTGQVEHGYQPGEHSRDGQGLWVDCVGKLAHNKPVPGVTGVTAAQAQACLAAEKAAHPPKAK
jgi:hypothetical protein